MKKLALWLISLLMVFAAACASGESGDLYDLYNNTKNGKVWLGNAVPILPGAQLASPAAISGEYDSPEVWDGANFNELLYATYTAKGKLLLMLSDMEDKTPGIPAYEVVDSNQSLQISDLIVRSGDGMGSRINRAVVDAVSFTWQEMDCLLLTLSGDTALGAPLQTKDGLLAGIVVAEYAEGENRYIALTIREIQKWLNEVADSLDEPEEEEDLSPEGYTVTVNGIEVTFDWSAVDLPAIPEGRALYLMVKDVDSSYVTYIQLTEEETALTMFLTPGRTYESGLIVGDANEAPARMPQACATTVMPEAEPLTEYSFKSEVLAIAEMAENAPADAMPTVPEEITEELLRSGRGCIYSVSSYDVDRIITSLPLLVTLTAPDGSNYRWESLWIYHPSYEQRDEWYELIDGTGLLEMLDINGYPEGEYEMCMYIDGKLADTFTFTLKK